MNCNTTPHIPLHIVKEILMRADVQTRVQSVLVCRDWNTLISDPDILSSSFDRADSKDQLLFFKVCLCDKSVALQEQTDDEEGYHYPYCLSPSTYSLRCDNDGFDLFHTLQSPPINDFKGTEVKDVSNGLVCLASKSPFKLILWNPIIRKYTFIPFPMTCYESLPMTCYETHSEIGFGFDRSSCDFKIVNLIHDGDGLYPYCYYPSQINSVWVFSYTTWSWKRPTCAIPPLCKITRTSRCIFLNGVFYWVALNKGDDQRHFKFILTFDVTKEVFGEILFPNGAHESTGVSTLGTEGNSLFLIEEGQDYGVHINEPNDENQLSPFFSVWILKQSGNHKSWLSVFSTTAKSTDEGVLGVRKNGDLLLDLGEGVIVRYNPTSSSPTYIFEKAVENSVFFSFFTESMYLLEKGDVISY